MVMRPLHQARFLSGPLAVLTLLLLAGCASAPKTQPVAAPEPVEEPAPMTEPAPAPAPVVELQPNYPQKYTVVKGDTLWDIAARFLKNPWEWPQLWQYNPQVKNPHLIYPGDILTIYFVGGKPVMQVQRKGETVTVPAQGPAPLPQEVMGKPYPTVKLKPRIRESGLEQAIPTIPLDVIKPLLTRPRVVSEDELEMAPYVMGYADEHMAAGAGYQIYARGIKQDEAAGTYVIVRAGQTYRDPETDEVLGHEAVYIGEARLQRYGDPSTLLVTESNREILTGDRLLPRGDDALMSSYMPRGPKQRMHGSIISVLDGVAQIGQYQVVVLNLGRQEDVKPGHVLAVYQRGKEVEDPVSGDDVKLPDQRAGEVMVFRVFERVSYALVMRATRSIHILDTVTNP